VVILLLKTYVKVNDKYYAGELSDTYKSSFSGVGFHDYKNCELSVLKFVDNENNAYVCEGLRNLNSIIERIMQRVKDNAIQLQRIEIINVGSNVS
jgi:hypothetical protein